MDERLKNIAKQEKNECDGLIIEVENGINIRHGRELDKQTEKVAYRHRLFHTACVCFSMFSLGWRNGLVGPTFPDLRLITNEDLSTASWLFTAISFGGLIGSVCGGFAYDRFNRIAVFICIVSGLGIVAGVAPWCEHFAAMFIVHVLHGGFASAIDTAVTADVAVIWRYQAGPFMQAVHGIFSVGAIVSPFVAEPYLAKKIDHDIIRSASTSNGTDSSAVTSASVLGVDQSGRTFNYSVVLSATPPMSSFYSYTNSTPSLVNISTRYTSSVDKSVPLDYGDTFIYIPYSLSTLICLIAASLYLVVYYMFGNVYDLPISSHNNLKKTLPKRDYFLSKRMKIIFTVLLALTMTLYVMGERSFIGFLMTFIISELGWSKARGSSASSTFWIAFAIGRLSGILIVKYVNISVVIMTFFLTITTGAVLFWIAIIYDINLLVWLSIATVGYGMSVVFASIFLWLSENIRKLTGKMASVLFIFFSSGAMVFPILVGHLMDKVSQMWFIYSQLILFSTMCILFIFVLVLFNILKKQHENKS